MQFASSLPSEQSLIPSHTRSYKIHTLYRPPQENSLSEHVLFSQFISSNPFPQSSLPSHCWVCGTHLPEPHLQSNSSPKTMPIIFVSYVSLDAYFYKVMHNPVHLTCPCSRMCHRTWLTPEYICHCRNRTAVLNMFDNLSHLTRLNSRWSDHNATAWVYICHHRQTN